MKNCFLIVLLFSSVAVASSLGVQARNPTPSKRYALPIVQARNPMPSKRYALPIVQRQPGPSKVPDKRSLVKRAPAPGPSAIHVGRDERLAARQASPSKVLSGRQPVAAPAPSKRTAEDSAALQKRSVDQQHVIGSAAESHEFCLNGLVACPVLSTPGQFPRTFVEWEAIGFECVDFAADLRSCGGCSSLDPIEHDCMNIPHVEGVACVAGECQISSCQLGYSLESDGHACSPSE
ncbi:uncharacterized protein F5147DRAFT_662623 [Suillus discolor]|uniref:Protein CPL1-like domain-containing protein n=1 Tax=Suillus discolor TaxID=1912936 RepID=A0A9P7FLQ8_9AGAM|nr:uncharacterized protein F5147DRAFT_662623 [Suillus discolor]KAG2120609.1 hypothetical protein F5147DRAFT_662623 [Suillus discolor]